MNISKFTQKSMQAVEGCEKLAYEYGNQEIEQEHLLYALLTQEDSLILKLMEKMGINKELLINRAEEALRKRTKVQGGQQYVGQELNKALIHAEDEAKQMGDEYVSVEHLFLSMLAHPGKEIKQLLKECNITRERFLQVLSQVRGNQKVTSDNPEATYDTLEKYRPIQVAYWLVNPYYEKIYGQVDDKKDLLELRNEFLSKEFWEYVLGRLNNVIDQGYDYLRINMEFLSVVKGLFKM